MDDLEEDFYRPRRSGAGRVVVTLVVLGALGLIAWAAEKRLHLVESVQASMHAAPQVPVVDPRIATLLAEGERDLLAGDVDGAQTAFDKVSVLTTVNDRNDPSARVALDLSRTASAKADVAWLKLRLLPADAADDLRIAKASLSDYAAVALHEAQDAAAGKPDDPQMLTAKIDAMRLAGETDAARTYVGAVIAKGAEPETAYVLAALDMTQPAPQWQSIVARLRVAAGGEWSSGRAHAALAYALVKAGDVTGAKAEMSKLDALSRPYPCLAGLRGLVASAPASGAAGSVAADARDAGAAAAAVAEGNHPAKGQGGGQGSADESGDTTPAGPLLAANQAMAVHDFSRAEQIYQGILAGTPGDSQALSGLGDIARGRGDSQGAISAYRRAVAVNPSYLPALLGLADTQWFGGDKTAAVSGYKNIEDHFPEGTYPEYVRSRAGGSN